MDCWLWFFCASTHGNINQVQFCLYSQSITSNKQYIKSYQGICSYAHDPIIKQRHTPKYGPLELTCRDWNVCNLPLYMQLSQSLTWISIQYSFLLGWEFIFQLSIHGRRWKQHLGSLFVKESSSMAIFLLASPSIGPNYIKLTCHNPIP